MKKLILTIAALAAFSVSQAQDTKKFMVVNLSTGIQKTIPVDEIADVEFQDMELNPALKTFEVNGVKFAMRKVEKGSFYMYTMDEDPSKKVTLTQDFWMAETMVTQDLYKAVIGDLPGVLKDWEKNDRYPIELTFANTGVFIDKLNELTGENFRLPTEEEWEYAAKGGKFHTPSTYSGSNDIFRVAWYYDNWKQASTDEHYYPLVATREPNVLGIYDMSGLAWEWTSTSVGGSDGHWIRGGSYLHDAENCTVLTRGASTAAYDRYAIRLVLTAE